MPLPRFKAHLHVEVFPPDTVVIIGEGTHVVIHGGLHPMLVPLVDGARSVDEIVEALDGRATAVDVEYGLAVLEEDGCLDDVDNRSAGPLGPASSATRGAEAPRLHPNERSPDRCSAGPSGPASLAARGAEAPRLHSERGPNVRVTCDYLDPALEEFAAASAASATPWTPVRESGPAIWIGPVIDPPRTPCWRCVTARVRMNQPWREEPVEWIVDAPPTAGQDEATLVTVDPATGEEKTHTIRRIAGCPICDPPSDPPIDVAEGLQALGPDQSIRWRDGGWRTTTAEETLARLMPHVSPITGFIDELERKSPPGEPLEVYEAHHLFPVPMTRRELMTTGGRRRATGKGIKPTQAKASALCEAVERYSGVYRRSIRTHRSTLSSLDGRAVPPPVIAPFSDAQYASRDRTNEHASTRAWVPVPFDERCEIDWVEARSLTNGCATWLPAASCFYGFPQGDVRFSVGDSNGCAAGNTLDEAILQGFLELVERDAVAIWWYNRIRRPSIDVEQFDGQLAAICERCRRQGHPLEVLDLTTDLGIPCAAAVSRWPSDAGSGNLLLGFGAHFDPAIAIARAITELVQWVPALEGGTAAERCTRDPGDAPFLTPAPEIPARTPADFVAVKPTGLEAAVDLCVARAAAAGLETIVLDQTHPDVGFPVVKVVVPGLRHFWPRFGAGRLYTVPVKMEWLPQARPESWLNPSHLLI